MVAILPLRSDLWIAQILQILQFITLFRFFFYLGKIFQLYALSVFSMLKFAVVTWRKCRTAQEVRILWHTAAYIGSLEQLWVHVVCLWQHMDPEVCVMQQEDRPDDPPVSWWLCEASQPWQGCHNYQLSSVREMTRSLFNKTCHTDRQTDSKTGRRRDKRHRMCIF